MDLASYNAKPEKTIQEHNEDLFRCLDTLWEYGYIKEKELYALGKKACYYHDFGKVNPEFQKRVNSDEKLRFCEYKEVAHNVLSLYFINSKDFLSQKDYFRVAFAVAFHHDYCDVFQTLINKQNLMKQLLVGFEKEIFLYPKTLLQTIKSIKSIFLEKESILLKGYLHKCDYSASGSCPVELPNDFLENYMKELLKKWRKDKPNSHWNEMQKFCKEHSGENIMVVAQTGMGKTEGALHWIGNNKGFFLLPLRTAINAMYTRMTDDIVVENKENRIALLHSASLSYLLDNQKNDKEMDVLEYYKKAKQLSMPLTITTMDQLFDFVRYYNGYEMKLTTLSYSRIVIDEIQMYGPDLLAYLVFGIEKICELGGKVAIFTATLAPFIRDLLLKKVNFQHQKFLDKENTSRHHIIIKQEKINVKDITEKYLANKAEGKPNKILVVCNTIRLAQQIYHKVRENLEEEDKNAVQILHSKFTRKDRRRLENEILQTGQTEDDKNEIWISTSIVEASLDIDFDYLFTELQDLNSLFQRMGRCNRKGKKGTEQPNCYIYTEIERGLLQNQNGGFIDNTIYSLSKEALIEGFSQNSGVITEAQKIQLLETYFTTENIRNSYFFTQYQDIYKYLEKQRPYDVDKKYIDLRNIESVDVIPEPIFKKNRNDYEELYNKWKRETDILERKRLEDKMKEDIVSISKKQYYSVSYRTKVLCGYDSIPVVECIYDEAGFQRKVKKPEDSSAVFL